MEREPVLRTTASKRGRNGDFGALNAMSPIQATLILIAIVLAPRSATAEATRPNVILIVADDLGIMDIGAYARHFTGAAEDELFYETPHLDALVGAGIPFAQSYANQLCSPTRAAILSGRVASSLGFTTATPTTRTYYNQGMTPPDGCGLHDAFDHKDPIPGPKAWRNAHSNTALDPSLETLPRVLATHDAAFLGKWHLGGHGVAFLQPAAHGFEELAFFDAGGSPYFNWRPVWDSVEPPFKTMPGPYRAGAAGEPCGEDYLTDDLSERACRYIRRRGQLGAGARPFFLLYCPFAVHTPLQAPEETVRHFAGKPQRGHLGHDHPTYAAMLKHLDDSVGKIRATLEEAGLADDTLLVFTSDNGGVEYTSPAATDNQPFLGGKACLYEGGIRVPTVFHWPGHFEGGTWCDEVFDATDFLPTLAEMTGNDAPAEIDGRSAVSLLRKPGEAVDPRVLYWHYPFNVIVKHPRHGTPLTPHSAIREGDLKLIWDWHGRLELYDIGADPYEARDLAAERPEEARRLHEKLKNWLEVHVADCYLPKRDPGFDAGSFDGPFPFRDLR